MTIVAAYKGPDGIYLGGDSLASDSSDSIYTSEPKVFSFKGFCIGYAGSFRFGQILGHCFLPPEHDPSLDDSTYMFVVWIEALRDTLSNFGHLKCEDGVDSIASEGAAIVVYRDSIYYVQEDLSLLKSASPYAAIGSGMSYALGAMNALEDSKLPGEDILRKSIEIAIKFSPRCGGDITILKHDPSSEAPPKKPRGRPKKNIILE